MRELADKEQAGGGRQGEAEAVGGAYGQAAVGAADKRVRRWK